MFKFKTALIGWAIELGALVAFVQAAKSEIWQWVRYPILLVAGLLVGIVFYRSIQRVTWQQVLSLCVLLILGSTFIFEVLAFTAYPGLAKELDFASADHVVVFCKLLMLSAMIHIGFLLLGVFGLKIVKWRVSSR